MPSILRPRAYNARMLEIGVDEVREKLERGEAVHLLDVREPAEVAICALPGAEHIPMLPLFLGTRRPSAAPDAQIVVFCHTGQRSYEAAQLLRAQGFPKARSMAGGIDAWAVVVDPSMPRY
jgi:rhodanese-related sulfurtransferase